MSRVATLTAVRRMFVTGDVPAVNADGVLSKDHADLVGRAANFRLEADALRERASASTERVIRDQYLALAERWASFAAGLEAELMSRLSE
jgi:hypothetical protein